MPGIAGIIGNIDSEAIAERLQRMTKCLIHESYYVHGNLVDQRIQAGISWIEIKDTFSDGMPVWNESKDVYLIFTGEEYRDAEQIASLRRNGHEFPDKGAHYLVHLYEDLGCDFFPALNGRFSGLLFDYRKNCAYLFNDRYGLSRIYYRFENGIFYFSSEAKSLLNVLPNTRQIDFRSLAETFSVGCVLQNRSLFQGISLLPGGSLWAFSPGEEVKKNFYFQPRDLENLEPLGASEYYEKLKETWAHILPRYMRDSERVALSLTGGKDSRMILAWAQKKSGDLPCYAFGGIFRDCWDVKIARRLAAACDQPFQVLRLDESFFEEFPRLAERTVYLTDGTMDLSGCPGLVDNRHAREIAPIRLTGNYAQEILRSAIAFKPMRLASDIMTEDFHRLVCLAPDTYRHEREGNLLSFIAFKQVPWHHYSRLASELALLPQRSPYLDNDLLRLAYQAPVDLSSRDDIQLRLISEGNALLGKIETDRGLLLKPIPFYTRMRKTYLDLTFKAEYAYDYGMPKSLATLDHRLRKLQLDRLLLGRHKYYHFRIWYQTKLSGYVRDVLLDPRALSRPYLNGRKIENIVESHVSGKANFTTEIHRLLTAELTHRTLTDS